MATMEEKCSSYSLSCLDDFKDDTFYATWFNSQFPIQCVTQIIMIEDVLKTEQAQQALTYRFLNMMPVIYKYYEKACDISYWKHETIQRLLCKHFSISVVMQLYKNIVTDNTYNILHFKHSRFMKCFKTAKDDDNFNRGFIDNNQITHQIVDERILNMLFSSMWRD